MSRSPFDLSFDDLVTAGAAATAGAVLRAEQAGVEVAVLDPACLPPTERSPWTSERLEVLRRLWIEGRSASEIAHQLGRTTRSAVLHKAHRLGLGARAERLSAGLRRISSG